jgi:hypothetical protein
MWLYRTAVETKIAEIAQFASKAGMILGGAKGADKKHDKSGGSFDGNFPYDVEFFGPKQCQEQIEYWNRIKKRRGSIDRARGWDRYRADCCLGKYEKEARRCSMDNELWPLWLDGVESGNKLTLQQVYNMVEIKKYRSMSEKHPDPAERAKAFEKLKVLVRGGR